MKRNILIITLGETPAVVTETIFELMRPDPPWIPAEIHIVTHTNGRHRCTGLLTGPSSELAAIFSARKQKFIEPVIHVPRTQHGQEIADIQTEADTVAFANTLTRLIKQLSENDNTAIHVSLSGGRKTCPSSAASCWVCAGTVILSPMQEVRTPLCRQIRKPGKSPQHIPP